MMKLCMAIALCSISFFAVGQTERNVPLFPATDSLGVFGEWQTFKYKGNKDEEIVVTCRFKVRKKFMMTCLFTVEIRNDGAKDAKLHFVAGNKGTNYYSGQIGVVNEKVKIAPKEVLVVDYRLPIPNNDKGDTDEMVCKKCKALEHFFTFTK